jgi:O-6-methylguanine DNA methyltransferase
VGRERVEPKEILDTDRLWAVFNKGYLIHLSLMGFPAGDLRNTKVDNLDFITADLTGDHPEDSDEFSEIEAMLLKETCSFLDTGKHHMPLDFSSFTPYQQTVFAEVLRIPPGTITTYKEIAYRIGNPNGSRAVGTAISHNPVAFFLPTHRVLPSTRGIGACKSGAGHLREVLLKHEGHDIDVLSGVRNKGR